LKFKEPFRNERLFCWIVNLMAMRYLSLVVVALIMSCGSEPASRQLDSMSADSIASAESELNARKNLTEYALTDKISVDVDGDGTLDILEFIVEGALAGKVLITHQGSPEIVMLVCEMDDGEYTSDFPFATNWGLLLDQTTTTTYAVDGELRDSIFTLENPAIELWQDGGGSGFFTFKGVKFIWVTTGC
jgi:hypothetical protein